MLDITHQNFEAELINASMQAPVLLDIWAPWCGPCKTLGPVLEKLETAYAGRFSLGKLNADEQPEIASQLSQMFGVRSIPFCVLFKGGQPIDGFVGALPEAEVRKFLDKHVPSAEEMAAEEDALEAEELMAEGDTASALEKLQAAVATNPANDGARYDYLRALLNAGDLDSARRVYEPVASKVMLDARLAAIGHWIAAAEAAPKARPVDTLEATLAANKRDFDARFDRARLWMAAGRWTEAMDELLEILMRDKTWNEDAARKTYIAILELIEPPKVKVADGQIPPDDPTVATYRRRLSSVVLS